MNEIPAPLKQRLETLAIPYRVHVHEPLFTVEQSQRLRGTIPGAHTKNLFLKDKKGGLFLVTAREETEINLKVLHQAIGARSRLSFGSAELLMDRLGVIPGAVTPLCALNDAEGLVRVILDRALMNHDQINCHPLINTMTITLTPDDLSNFLKSTDHEPTIMELPA